MPPTFFTPTAVSKCIKQLKKNDSRSFEFYKTAGSYILYPLSVTFDVSIQTGELPRVWKCASVTPAFKKERHSSSKRSC